MGLARRRDGADRSAEVAGTLVLAQSGLHATDRARTGFSDSESGPRGHGVRIEAGIGRRIGRYRLVEPLGAGSQAVVWRAVLGGTAGREVALKLLVPAQHINRCKVARLRREAARGQRLSRTSAAILPTLEFGVADGVVFMAMPLVEGCSLRDIILQRRRVRRGEDRPFHRLATLPPREYARSVLGVLARITRALQVAHEARVAHRDVKPANILLEWHDEMRCYLTDFGLARDLDIATLEQLHDGAGTSMYMAPEKLQDRHHDEIRCDIYALDVTLYEALTLTPPLPVRAGCRGTC